MATTWEEYGRYSRRRQRQAGRSGQRLDVQGLRMVAVLTVLANHLWSWPRGGFIGVDVFFVISGFLITGNLLRDAEKHGQVSFRRFYWNRVRRIVPAATVVLILTYLTAVTLFQPFRAQEVGVDALWAFAFLSNWWFAYQGTDYFRASADTLSPIQHYWSLSIEEQFYFVWPALIFLVSTLVLRKAWSHRRRMQLAGAVMGGIVVASLSWGVYQTATSPAFAYFNTFARVWELGVGALLATAVGVLARIPDSVRPFISWFGLALIAASLYFISDGSVGFPSPWALLPVSGAALVIAAGIGSEPKYQAFLRNPVSGYIGDISYSLYLVHWPVIVMLSAVMDPGVYFSIVAVALTFALAIASFHFVETPLRRAQWGKFRDALRTIRERQYSPQRSSVSAAVGALTLIVIATVGYTAQTGAQRGASLPPVDIGAVAADTAPSGAELQLGPLATGLQGEIVAALNATEWPTMDPSMESVIDGLPAPAEVYQCSRGAIPDVAACTWGSPTAATDAVLVGNSMGMAYSGPLREMALNSGGQLRLHTEAKAGCYFSELLIDTGFGQQDPDCPARKRHAIDYINQTKPDVVIIANSYNEYTVLGTGQQLTVDEWIKSVQALITQFRGSTQKIVILAPPPSDADIRECFSSRTSTPADCVTKISDVWRSVAEAEQQLAESIGGTWVSSLPWFCNVKGTLCPAVVATTPTKMDRSHMSPPYGHKIYPVMAETFIAAGVYLATR